MAHAKRARQGQARAKIPMTISIVPTTGISRHAVSAWIPVTPK
jgi:hypothetical protein